MLIETLKIVDHPAIGTVELDFRDETGAPARTVVIAGLNGTGKTAILDAIYGLLDDSAALTSPVEALIKIDESEAERIRHVDGSHVNETTTHLLLRRENSTTLGLHDDFSNQFFGINNATNGFKLRAFYSPANVTYSGGSLQSVTADRTDRPDLLSYRGGSEGQTIPQLLLALDYIDAMEVRQAMRANPAAPPVLPASLLDRFRNAYADMLSHKRLYDIKSEAGQYDIIFKEFGVETRIDRLSTGEKQIVLRAGQFIRDAGVMQKDIILIDEPELSLSPDWQAKILNFYAKTLSVDGAPYPQIICATHSPFIVHSANAGKVIVLQRGDDGRVGPMLEPMFPQANSAVAVRAFNLDRFVREARPGGMTVITEGDTDHLILEAAWNKLHPGEPMPFQISPGTGARPLQTLLNSALPTLTREGKAVGLFDFDDAWGHWHGVWKSCPPVSVNTDDATGQVKRHPDRPAWAMLLPVPAFRAEMASSTFAARSLLSIELMFPDAVIPASMTSDEKRPGGFPMFLDSRKREFAETIVDTIDAAHFATFQPLFARLLEIFAAR